MILASPDVLRGRPGERPPDISRQPDESPYFLSSFDAAFDAPSYEVKITKFTSSSDRTNQLFSRAHQYDVWARADRDLRADNERTRHRHRDDAGPYTSLRLALQERRCSARRE